MFRFKKNHVNLDNNYEKKSYKSQKKDISLLVNNEEKIVDKIGNKISETDFVVENLI
ncbi:hypothetical protein SAMN04488530_101178, partial [Asaccharospora irregularis DSM 2635]